MTSAGSSSRALITGRTVLLRADLTNGVTDDLARTIGSFAAQGARTAVIAGFGAPGGDVNATLSLASFRGPLELACGRPVTFIPHSVGPEAEAELAGVAFGEVALMENLRFHPDERRNTRTFAIRLSALGDYFAVCGFVPPNPIGWLVALAAMLPAPYGAVASLPGKET